MNIFQTVIPITTHFFGENRNMLYCLVLHNIQAVKRKQQNKFFYVTTKSNRIYFQIKNNKIA